MIKKFLSLKNNIKYKNNFIRHNNFNFQNNKKENFEHNIILSEWDNIFLNALY